MVATKAMVVHGLRGCGIVMTVAYIVSNLVGLGSIAAMSGYTWHGMGVDNALPTVCKHVATAPGDCGDSWKYREFGGQGHCYLALRGSYTYNSGLAVCMSYRANASLVSIHSEEENVFVGELGDGEFLIGLYGETGNEVWSDGSPYDYRSWEASEQEGHKDSSELATRMEDTKEEKLFFAIIKLVLAIVLMCLLTSSAIMFCRGARQSNSCYICAAASMDGTGACVCMLVCVLALGTLMRQDLAGLIALIIGLAASGCLLAASICSCQVWSQVEQKVTELRGGAPALGQPVVGRPIGQPVVGRPIGQPVFVKAVGRS